ncbi:MFS transporter [Paenibacillus planticolens]|uniref:MFS transporter n=1 Tax=Paenibacillus planticolens TaxID=2654976 RepID=A0ABX1ZQ34_9BACL|nr:MFS transporter [Paenibacillus planticolens]NOV00997.1 MFS transporter [Paenibacillus planticolens]
MKTNPFIDLFKNKNYARLFAAQLTSQIGSVTGLTAFAFYMLDHFSSQPAYATITEMMYSLPTLAIFFLTGVAADRFDRQKIAVNCDMINIGLSLTLLGAIAWGWMPLVFALLFLRSAVSKMFHPANAALVRGVLHPEQIPSAMGMNQMLMSAFILLGTSLGAVCYWHLGILASVAIDMLSFSISAVFIARCRIPLEVRLPNGPSSWKSFKLTQIGSDFMEGLRYVRHNPIVLALLTGILILGLANGGGSVMYLFNLKYKLAPDTYESLQIGMTAILGAGMIVGSLISVRLVKKIPLHQMIILSFFLGAVVHGLQAVVTELVPFMALYLVYALSVPLCNVAFFGWLAQVTEPKMMGRVQALIQPLMMITFTAMQGLIAFAFPKQLSLEAIYYTVGAAEFVLALYYLLLLPSLAQQHALKKMKSLAS